MALEVAWPDWLSPGDGGWEVQQLEGGWARAAGGEGMGIEGSVVYDLVVGHRAAAGATVACGL